MKKRCKTCRKVQPAAMFYRQASNRDGLKTACRRCLLNQYAPVMHGELRCRICCASKPFSEFTVHRTNKTGRSSRCKTCANVLGVQRRHACRPVYAPASGWRATGVTYVRRVCVWCKATFEPFKKLQTRCAKCGQFFRSVWSHLSASRPNATRIPVRAALVALVADALYFAKSCVYCGRAFSAQLKKSIDHVTPVCRGGARDQMSNIAICCADCNASKASLPLDAWVALCKLVVARSAHSERTVP